MSALSRLNHITWRKPNSMVWNCKLQNVLQSETQLDYLMLVGQSCRVVLSLVSIVACMYVMVVTALSTYWIFRKSHHGWCQFGVLILDLEVLAFLHDGSNQLQTAAILHSCPLFTSQSTVAMFYLLSRFLKNSNDMPSMCPQHTLQILQHWKNVCMVSSTSYRLLHTLKWS